MKRDMHNNSINQVDADSVRNFFTRIRIYLEEMYPPRHIVFGLLFFMSAWCGIDLLSSSCNGRLFPSKIVFFSGAVTIPLFLLLLRIMDELKDRETDPFHFPDRPVSRGDVHFSDLKIFIGFIIVVLFMLNLFITHATLIFLLVFGYACLMYKYFFLKERISKNILMALLTHSPISYLLFLYVLFIFKNNMATSIPIGRVLLLGTVFLCSSMSWEVARKIRRPENETAYQTYSKVLGFLPSLLLPIVLSVATIVVMTCLYPDMVLGIIFFYMIAVYLFMAMTYLSFYNKQPVLFGLKTTTEIFIANIHIILVMLWMLNL